MKARNNLSNALSTMQNNVIGLAIDRTKAIHLITEQEENGVVTIRIGTLLGLTTHHAHKDFYNHVIMFPDNKTLSQMMYSSNWLVWYEVNVLPYTKE